MEKEKNETCNHCETGMIGKEVTLLRRKNDRIYSFRKTPAQVCPECGECWYSTDILKKIDDIIAGEIQFPYQTIQAEEYDLSA